MAAPNTGQTWQNTDAYEAYMGRWSRPMAEAALRWLQPATGQSWLDVGCGTGALTQAILDTAAPHAVLGVDPSAGFLATAAAQIEDPRVRFEVGTAADLPAHHPLLRTHRYESRRARRRRRDGSRRACRTRL